MTAEDLARGARMRTLAGRAESLALFLELGADRRAAAIAARNLARELAAIDRRGHLRRVA
jgi:hypothetical protein